MGKVLTAELLTGGLPLVAIVTGTRVRCVPHEGFASFRFTSREDEHRDQFASRTHVVPPAEESQMKMQQSISQFETAFEQEAALERRSACSFASAR